MELFDKMLAYLMHPLLLYGMLVYVYIYSVSRKKRDKNVFFCNISYKTLAVLMKFGT